MKITFEHYNTNQTVEKNTTAKSTSDTKEARGDSGYIVDISNTVMDNKAYGGQGKTTEDVMQDAGRQDVAWQKNYMVVMSNSMSEEDYKKIREGDFDPGSTDMETVVTILDQIKASMAQAGIEVVGYTDDIDTETLTAIVGDEALAGSIKSSFDKYNVPYTKENILQAKQVIEEARKLTEPTEGAEKYLVENQKAPIVENLYVAQFSASSDGIAQGKGYYQDEFNGYYAKKAEEFDWEQLSPQIDKIIENAGLGQEDGIVEEAKWLIEKGIPLTERNLQRIHELESLKFPVTDQAVSDAAARAIVDGKTAKQADLTKDKTILERAVDIYEKFQDISNMPTENIAARRQLEEVRLQMTIQANIKLLKSGYSIDTAPLEELVEKLKVAEQEINQALFKSDDVNDNTIKAGLYQETLQKVSEIPLMPAALIGKIANDFGQATIRTVYETGTQLQTAYQKAEETYEALMTAPRKDLGDSIQKAFRNVDDILVDLALETSEQNQRAVRILAYNNTAITRENISMVKEADQTVQNVIQNMTPSMTLQMIRHGKNPLTMSLEEIQEFQLTQNSDLEKETEKYSKFLYNMEQNHDITEEERESFVGIYRLMRQIEKSDGAVIGSLLEQGAEINFRNLLSAVRSSKKKGTDIQIGDDFGSLKDKPVPLKSISGQIAQGFSETEQNYYKQLAQEVYQNLTPEQLKGMDLPNATLEEFVHNLQKEKENKESNDAYSKQQVESIRQLQRGDDTAIKELLDYNQPVTVNNLIAVNLMMNQRGTFFNRLFDKSGNTDKGKEELKKAAKQLTEGFDSEEETKSNYDNLVKVSEEIIEEFTFDSEKTLVDVREMSLLHKQLSLAGNLAKEENYEVPIELDGKMSSIRLKIIHNKDSEGKVEATFESKNLGKVAAEFKLQSGEVSGYMVCATPEGLEQLRSQQAVMIEQLKQQGFDAGKMNLVEGKELNINTFGQDKKAESSEKTVTSDLYKIAKIFIQTLEQG